MDHLKRELREEKRQVKKRGNKHRRQQLNRALRDNPEEAHLAIPSFGRHRSADLNGKDHDSKRARPAGPEPSPSPPAPEPSDPDPTGPSPWV